MNKTDKIFIAGSTGMVGSAIVRILKQNGYHNLLTPSSKELNLISQSDVSHFFRTEKPQFVFLAAGKVGGIMDNTTRRAEFIYENIMIESNVIHASYEFGVNKLLFLGSSCIYPKMAPQPIKEDYLLTGSLEYTNQPYAIAKIAGIELCDAYRKQYGCNFISAMPTNLYGPNDHYDLNKSHVLPALLRKFIEAKDSNNPVVSIWGSGTPRREFLHVDDLANACFHLMNNYNEATLINIGVGKDISIVELAELIKNIVGYTGTINFDTSKPDGTPRKLMDVSKLNSLGWQSTIDLEIGIRSVYEEILRQRPW